MSSVSTKRTRFNFSAPLRVDDWVKSKLKRVLLTLRWRKMYLHSWPEPGERYELLRHIVCCLDVSSKAPSSYASFRTVQSLKKGLRSSIYHHLPLSENHDMATVRLVCIVGSIHTGSGQPQQAVPLKAGTPLIRTINSAIMKTIKPDTSVIITGTGASTYHAS